jgi:IS30 family transposase
MRHLQYIEIERIQTLRWENRSQSYIANKVWKNQSTISRFCSLYPKDMLSTDIRDIRKVTRVSLNKNIHCRIHSWSHLEKYILFRLSGTKENPLRDSPDQIAERWRMEQWEKLSKDTIYTHIKEHHPNLISHFRRQGKKYKKKRETGEEKYQIQDRVMIEKRWEDYPLAEIRSEIWHWEIDTVISAKTRSHGIITAADRTSGLLLTSHTKKKTAWNICDELKSMFENIPKEYKKTLTSDNGREFAYHKIVSYETGMNFYFANPYSPWERWTNENVNWLLRQFLPKKESFANLTTKTLQSYTKSINSRPRKRYNYRTPEEIFFGRTERLTDLCNLN